MSDNSLRNRFKPSTTTAVEQESKKAPGADRAGFHTLAVGANYFRLAPVDDESAFWRTVSRFNLPSAVKNDQGVPTGEIKRKQIFDARVHGHTTIDLVDSYVQLARRTAQSMDDQRSKAFLAPILGSGQGKAFVGGITQLPATVTYAWQLSPADDGSWVFGKLDRLEVKNSAKIDLNKLIAGSASVGTEPFTDVDTGMPICITSNPNAQDNRQKFVAVFAAHPKIGYPKPCPIPTAQLEILVGLDSLTKLYSNSYKKSDLEYGWEGLCLFEQIQNAKPEHQAMGLVWNLTTNPEMLEILTYLRQEYSDGSGATTNIHMPGIVQNQPSVNGASSAIDELTPLGRKELRAIIAAEALPIIVGATVSDDSIRESIRDARGIKALTQTPPATPPSTHPINQPDTDLPGSGLEQDDLGW